MGAGLSSVGRGWLVLGFSGVACPWLMWGWRPWLIFSVPGCRELLSGGGRPPSRALSRPPEARLVIADVERRCRRVPAAAARRIPSPRKRRTLHAARSRSPSSSTRFVHVHIRPSARHTSPCDLDLPCATAPPAPPAAHVRGPPYARGHGPQAPRSQARGPAERSAPRASHPQAMESAPRDGACALMPSELSPAAALRNSRARIPNDPPRGLPHRQLLGSGPSP